MDAILRVCTACAAEIGKAHHPDCPGWYGFVGADQCKVQPAAPSVPASDPVFRPSYYTRFVIEPITFIMANKLPFDIGSIVKYVLRYDAKNGLEDLKKARRFLDIRIETLERERRIASGEDPKAVWSTTL